MTSNSTTEPQPAQPAGATDVTKVPDASVPPRWVVRTAWVAHRALVSVTRGRIGYRPATAEQWGMLRLRTVGRRSGRGAAGDPRLHRGRPEPRDPRHERLG